jgi:hypothetical protein
VSGSISDGVAESSRPRLPEEYFRVPGSARIWSYWMSGKDPYPVDR